MNKRISKKLHKKYLIDVVYAVSVSSLWRKKLFDSNYGEKIILSYHTLTELPKYIKQPIVRYKLQYNVYKTKEILNADFYYKGGVFFKFESIKFMSICEYSFNNIEVL